MRSTEEMNRRLHGIYEDAVAAWTRDLSTVAGVSRPLLMYVPESYAKTAVKLMVVGQETYGWGDPETRPETNTVVEYNTVDALVGLYRGFDLARHYRRRSYFWRAAHRLYRELNPGGEEHAFVWSNLVKVDQNKRRPEFAVEEAICRLGLLEKEIEITKPDVVIFFTGPTRDERLRSTFPDVVYEELFPGVVQLRHSALPARSYRTYHPSYLKRSRRWGDLERLLSHIQAA
jgi:hypothetical protein